MADLISADVSQVLPGTVAVGAATVDYTSVNLVVPTKGPTSRAVCIGYFQAVVPATTTSLLERVLEVTGQPNTFVQITTDNNEAIKGAIGSFEWSVVCAVRQQVESDGRFFQCKHIDNGGSGNYNVGNAAVLVLTFD